MKIICVDSENLIDEIYDKESFYKNKKGAEL